LLQPQKLRPMGHVLSFLCMLHRSPVYLKFLICRAEKIWVYGHTNLIACYSSGSLYGCQHRGQRPCKCNGDIGWLRRHNPQTGCSDIDDCQYTRGRTRGWICDKYHQQGNDRSGPTCRRTEQIDVRDVCRPDFVRYLCAFGHILWPACVHHPCHCRRSGWIWHCKCRGRRCNLEQGRLHRHKLGYITGGRRLNRRRHLLFC